MGCKRITPSDEYIESFTKPCVKLITEKIDIFTKNGIKTVDKKEHKVDVVIYATGFDVLRTANPFHIIGANGTPMKEVFGDTPMAYLGCTHPNMPNYFFLLGPGTGLGHSTIIYMIECQV